MATDAVGIALALGAVTLAQRPARGRRTFGWQRIEILAAVVNGLLLVAVAVYVLVEAVRRIGHPPDIGAGLMLAVAVGRPRGQPRVPGPAAPGEGRVAERARRLPRGARRRARLGRGHRRRRPDRDHGLDAGRRRRLGRHRLPRRCRAPGTCSARRSTSSWRPRRGGSTSTTSARTSLGVDGVLGVHDLHAWTITSGLPVLSAHVVVTDEALAAGHGGRVLDALCSCLGEHFDVEHCTFQLEARGPRRPRVARPRLNAATSPAARGGTVEPHTAEQQEAWWSTGSTRACGCPTPPPDVGPAVPAAPRAGVGARGPQRRGAGRLPGRRAAAAPVRRALALVAHAGLDRRHARRCSP